MTKSTISETDRVTKFILPALGGMIALALSFWFFTTFTHQAWSTKGSLGGLRNLHGISSLIAGHAGAFTACLLFLIVGVVGVLIATVESQTGDWAEFFESRPGASVLLLTVTFCQLPIYFTRGLMDYSDPLCHINAMIEAADNYRQGQWPFYTFHFANGATLGLQYPMLRTLLGGIFFLLSPGSPELKYQLLCAAAHIMLMVGFYRFLRTWKFSRLASLLPALTLVGCHQMLVYYLSGSLPTSMSTAFAVWCFAALIRWFRKGDWHHAAACGYWLGLAVLAHPVTALFTAYFLFLLSACLVGPASWEDRKRFAQAGWAAAICGLMVALPYLVSLVTFRSYDTYRPDKVAFFQDTAPAISSNFKWIFKYFGTQSADSPAGEYISIILCALAAIGLGRLVRSSSFRQRATDMLPYYPLACWMFLGAGAILFYGRDTALVSAIPSVKLLKVYNRSFIFFSLGLGLLAAAPIHKWVLQKRYGLLLALVLSLLFEQLPFWARPTYFSLPDNLKFNAPDFAGYDAKTSSFLVIFPSSAGGCGNREDVLFHRVGFSGLSPVEHEEQSVAGQESEILHSTMAELPTVQAVKPLIDRLKWLRVTDVVWRYDAVPPFDLNSLGQARNVTHGLDLHLDGPTMERDLRTLKLQVSSKDVQPDHKILLPVGFSSFLHCWRIDSPKNELPLLNRNGYTLVDQPLPVDTGLIIKSITPFYQSAVTWFSLFFDLGMGFYLLTRHRRASKIC